MSAPGQRSPLGVGLLGGGAAVVGQLPVFLVGALAVQLTDEFAFGAAGIGAAVGIYRITTAVSATYLGRMADQWGAAPTLRVVATLAIVATVGTAVGTRGWTTLVAWLLVAAAANALAHAGSNRLLVDSVPKERQGVAFGIKQSAPPAASLLAGLSVPLLAVTLGWRWTYVAAAGIAALVLLATRGGGRAVDGDREDRTPQGRGPLPHRGTLIVLSVGLGCATGAATSVPAFYVDSAVRIGTSPEAAGTLLAVASLASIASRLVGGAVADRMPAGHLYLCAGMQAAGAAAIAVIAVGALEQSPATMAVGAILGLGLSWGMSGMFFYALMQAYRDAPGRATGFLVPGGATGAGLGPAAFGAIAEWVGYPPAWFFLTFLGLLSATVITLGGRRLARASAADRPAG